MEKFSASRAERLMNCTASGDLDTAIPNWKAPIEDPDADTAANRGTRMHELFAMTSQLTPKEMWAMTKALQYVAVLRQRRRFTVLSEQTEMADWLNTPVSTTADLVLYTKDEIHIIDFKWGKILVEAMNNEQLLYYAATYAKYAPKAKEVTLHIVQPNADNFEEWTVPTAYILGFMVKARQAQDDLLAGNLSFLPGDHCTFCPANPHSRGAKGSPLCPTVMQMLYPAPFDEDALLEEET